MLKNNTLEILLREAASNLFKLFHIWISIVYPLKQVFGNITRNFNQAGAEFEITQKLGPTGDPETESGQNSFQHKWKEI